MGNGNTQLNEAAAAEGWTLLNDFLSRNSTLVIMSSDEHLTEIVNTQALLFRRLQNSNVRACASLARGKHYFGNDFQPNANLANRALLATMNAMKAAKENPVYRKVAPQSDLSILVNPLMSHYLSDNAIREIALLETDQWSDETECEYMVGLLSHINEMPIESRVFWFASYLNAE
jgi:hypothetical protein